jgi:hypothetical protein
MPGGNTKDDHEAVVTRAERRRRERQKRAEGRPRALGVDWTLERSSRAVRQGHHVGGEPGRGLTDEEVQSVRSAVNGILESNRETLARAANERLRLETWQVDALNRAITLPLCERLMRLGVAPPRHAILATVLGEGGELAEIVTDERVFVAVTSTSGTTLILPGTALHEYAQDIKAIHPAAPVAAFALFAGGWRDRPDGRPGTVFSTSVVAWDVRGLAVTAPGSAVDALIGQIKKVGTPDTRRKRAALLERFQQDVRREITRDAVVGEITDPITLRVPLAGRIQQPGPAVSSWFDTGAFFRPWLFFRLLDALLGVEQPLGLRGRARVEGGDEGLRAIDQFQPDSLPVETAKALRDVEMAKDFAAVWRLRDQLPERERQALDHGLAAEREGVKLRAYCKAEGLRYDTVRQALLRAKERLRKKFATDVARSPPRIR